MKLMTEFLQSANKEKFTQLLLRRYKKYIFCFAWNDNEKTIPQLGDEVIGLICYSGLYNELLNKTDIIHFCRKLNWVVTFTDDIGSNKILIIIEPIKSKKLKLNSNKYLYHITYRKYIDKILDRGLRCVGAFNSEFNHKDIEAEFDTSIYQYPGLFDYKKTYRTITPRIFVINSNDKDDVLNIAEQLDEQYNKHSEMIVLKIDCSKHNFDIYQDNINPSKNNCGYLLEDIPKDIISIDTELTELIRNTKSKAVENFVNEFKNKFPNVVVENNKLVFYNKKNNHNGGFSCYYELVNKYGLMLHKILECDSIHDIMTPKSISFEIIKGGD